jgi:hypothetical protein
MPTPQTPEANHDRELFVGGLAGFCAAACALGTAAFGGRTVELMTDGISNSALEWGIYGGGAGVLLLGTAACGFIAFRNLFGQPAGRQQ